MANDIANQTQIAPLGLAILFILMVLLLFKNKDYIFISFVILSCFVSSAQRIVIADIDFTFIRIFIVFTYLRIVLRNEWVLESLHKVDILVLLYGFISIFSFTLLHSSISALINSLGDAFDTIGAFFIFRNYLRDYKDITYIIKLFAISSLIIFPFFFFESITGFNIFSYFGGVPVVSAIREGKVRCQGAFPHPIIAGSFWAVLVPLIWSFWNTKIISNKIVFFSIVSSILIILFSASSTPLMSVFAGFLFLGLYQFRKSYKEIKILLISSLVILQLIMDNPIWYLLMKIDIVGGSTGFFRFLLIDKFVENWREWFFLGIVDTYHWGEGYNLPSIGLSDLTNKFVAEGATGGIFRLLLFLIIFFTSYRIIEKKKDDNDFSHNKMLLWGILASLFIHFMNFWGVTYFGQMTYIFWMGIAICINIEYYNFNNTNLENKYIENGLKKKRIIS